ncbi:SDR family oxidoreductase [Wenjunlia tyrosinilytica]|uniref:3-dehydrosphinganine reductase n=1 Tax=Wenjunlia tyrosinilytica TaxID=1544741 RepID=A0A917ZT36_9ACTN|nr:SDR family oxidoreductase [Wenjunlia tyrosinilytica]GGO89414.1 3-ketodihydrosphingosine reductase [Wenjunlia tyrosinilytica]
MLGLGSPKGPRVDFGHAHAVVTGGSSGIGLATARELARRGTRLSLVARGSERLESAAAELAEMGAEVAVAPADVSDRAALTAALDRLVTEQGPCDILVASAGLARPGHFLDLPDEVFRQMMEVDYFGTLYALRAVLPGMAERRRGSVVAVSSAAGLLGIFGYSAYGPAKFAVRGLMESVRAELAPLGVHAGVVFPPDVDTPQLAEENRWKPAETFAVSGTVKPLTPQKVAEAIVSGIASRRFLICPDPATRALARWGSVLAPVLNRRFDRKVAAVRGRSLTAGRG